MEEHDLRVSLIFAIIVSFMLLQSPVQSIRGKNLDFSRSTIPTVGRCEKFGVFGKHRNSRSGLL